MTDVAFIADFLKFNDVLIRIGNNYKYNYLPCTKQEIINNINQHPNYTVRNKALQDLELIEESKYTDFIDVHAYRNGALRYAAYNGHLNVVQYLVEQGADVSTNNYQALKWAKEKEHTEVVEYLESIIN